MDKEEEETGRIQGGLCEKEEEAQILFQVR